MSSIGEKISQLRKTKGFTQEELSERAKINLRTLQRIECSETEPRANTLKNLCSALQVDIEDIIENGMVENHKYLAWLHLSVTACFLMPLGCIIVPLILWFAKKDKIVSVREQGINILNFQILWYALTVIAAGIILFNEYSRATYYLLIFFLVTNGLYPVIVSLQIRKGKIRNYYPSLIRIVK